MTAGNRFSFPRSFSTRLLALVVLVLFAACAPNPSMIATLTMLPGTPTPRPPTPWPSITPHGSTPTATLRPSICSPFAYDSSAPDDASQMVGQHYNLERLPKAFQQPESGPLSDPLYRWVRVTWQGRALYWIERQDCIDASGSPQWVVIDALALPRLDQALGEVETRACFNGSQKADDIIAYGMLDPGQPGAKTLKVQSAWSMKPVNGEPRFSVIDVGDLSCAAQAAP